MKKNTIEIKSIEKRIDILQEITAKMAAAFLDRNASGKEKLARVYKQFLRLKELWYILAVLCSDKMQFYRDEIIEIIQYHFTPPDDNEAFIHDLELCETTKEMIELSDSYISNFITNKKEQKKILDKVKYVCKKEL